MLIAKQLYNLNLDEWKYICSTSIFGESDSKAELDEIISVSIDKWET